MQFSIIIPVYNRPEELSELLESIVLQDPFNNPEVIIVEDGSTKTSSAIVDEYDEKLNLKYCYKKNSGPGDSRNYGMNRAEGDYFILLDSDCILPTDYLINVETALANEFTDAFGGPDAAHASFSSWQKAINYSMTSLLTTGGLRNKESASRKFQLRSFNMGISKRAFHVTGGFSKQRIGEDIDLNFKLLKNNLTTQLISEAFVYHKRRSSWLSFFKQTNNFGAARPILNRIHSGSSKLSYWLPSLFVFGFLVSCILFYFGYKIGMIVFIGYTLMVFIDSLLKSKSFPVAMNSIFAVYIQFFGYGLGFLRSMYRLYLKRMTNREAFPGMFA